MPFILEYLIKFSISLALLYSFYQFVLRQLTFYQLNRFYLGCYSLLSFVIPFVNVTPWINENESSALLQVIPAFGQTQLLPANGSDGWWAILVQEKWRFVLVILGAGSLFMLLKIMYQYLSLQKIKRKAVLTETSSVKLYDVKGNISPFSFANAIFINSKLHTPEELQKILQHEFVHVKQKHTADILIGEVLIIINWFNPFAWLMRKAIRQNLEFIADDNVLQSGLDARQYQYLLLKVVGVPQYSITNNFNFSSLKKRIVMMNKMKTTKVHLLKFLFIVPLLGLILVSFRHNNELSTVSNVAKTSPLLFHQVIADTVPKPASPAVQDGRKPDHNQSSIKLRKQNQLPENVNSITITTGSGARVKLKNGTTETYDLSSPEEKASFEKKYGKLVPPPPPPVAPVAPVAPVPQAPLLAPVTPVPPAKPLTVLEEVVPSVAIRTIRQAAEPLVILDGELLPAGTDMNTIDPESIESIHVIKGDHATSLYGDKGVNGVIIITTKINYVKTETKKKEDGKMQAPSVKLNKILDFNGLVVINGKESTKEVLWNMDGANIKAINILKDESATKMYKEKGINGVILVTTR